MSTVVDLIGNKITFYDNFNEDWVQFVKDHKQNILAESIRREPSLVYQFPYQYNLKRYLESIRFDTSMTWLVRYINGYDTDKDFVDVDYIYVPDLQYIQNLYEVFRTIQATEKGL